MRDCLRCLHHRALPQEYDRADRNSKGLFCTGAWGARPLAPPRHPPADTHRPECARAPRAASQHPPAHPGARAGTALLALGLDTHRRTGEGRTARGACLGERRLGGSSLAPTCGGRRTTAGQRRCCSRGMAGTSGGPAKGRAVVFIEQQAVEAHFFGIDLLIEIAVVEFCSQFWVINIVADGQVHDGLTCGTKGVRLL